MSQQTAFAKELEILRRAWESHGIHRVTKGSGAFMKLRTLYFVRQEFEDVLGALRSLPSVESGQLPPAAIKYLWRMNEFLSLYRDNYIPGRTAKFLSDDPIDIKEYDAVQAQILSELNRILGSPVDEI